jgi:hypothetical protein
MSAALLLPLINMNFAVFNYTTYVNIENIPCTNFRKDLPLKRIGWNTAKPETTLKM